MENFINMEVMKQSARAIDKVIEVTCIAQKRLWGLPDEADINPFGVRTFLIDSVFDALTKCEGNTDDLEKEICGTYPISEECDPKFVALNPAVAEICRRLGFHSSLGPPPIWVVSLVISACVSEKSDYDNDKVIAFLTSKPEEQKKHETSNTGPGKTDTRA